MAIFNVHTLTAELDKLRIIIEKRNEVFSERTDKWQGSEKGEEYDYKTQELEQCADDLEQVIDTILEL